MRAPRYRFPDQVRSTTRAMARQMVRDNTVPPTAEALDAWIARAPDIRQALEKGGYNTAFTSRDLFPLLQVFVVDAGGAVPTVDDAPPRALQRRWRPGVMAVVAAVVAVLIVVALAAAI